MSGDRGDGTQAYTVRLELEDRPGELLRALEPIAANGGNLLSIFHERGSVTPRGHIPVEIDLESPPDRFDAIVDALRDAGVNVIQAGAEAYSEEVVVLLVGDLVAADLSGTITAIEADATARVADLSLTAPEGTEDGASAMLRLAAESGSVGDALAAVRAVAADRGLGVIEPVEAGVDA